MDIILIFLSLAVALWALSRGRSMPLLVFNVVGLLWGPSYIPHVFSILAAFNIAYLLFLLKSARADVRAGSGGG